jgi:5-(carboxyamino)imidazole ribonucleotide mutase
MTGQSPWVGILMGSSSDANTLEPCWQVLKEYGIPYEVRVLSAHRTPEETVAYIRAAEGRGIVVLVAAAGMAAHLAGACAAHGTLPVIGVPIASGPLHGSDALLSTVMMPPGLPVATVGINGAANAGHLAAQILALAHPELKDRLKKARAAMREKVLAQDREMAGGTG